MKRIARVIGLNAADIPEYKRLHAALWPEIKVLLYQARMRIDSTFLKEPEILLIAASDDMKRWWALTDPRQRPLNTRKAGEWWVDMEEVFHAD